MQENWNIIPIRPNGKKPSIKWRQYILKKYEGKFKEGCNEGVICGPISGNLVILDLDYKDNNKQFYKKIFAKFHKKYRRLSETYIEETPNGHHFFYYVKGECPKRELKQDTKKKIVLEKFYKQTVSNFPHLLKGVDILGEGGYSLIAPSIIDGKEYKPLNDCKIKTITKEIFDKIVRFFLLEKPVRKKMRKPFVDILKGNIEIEEQALKAGKDEHVYWKYLFLEAWYYLDLKPEDLFELLEENQPTFDLNKTRTQLRYIDFEDKPFTNETLYEYFPKYKPKFVRKKKDGGELAPYLIIANELKEEFDVITIEDSNQIMIKKGNIYSFNTKEFYKRLGEKIENFTTKSYTYVRNNVLKYIKDTTLFNRKNFCYDKWVINFKNGYFDVKTNMFYKNEDHHDKIFCYEIPHDYKKGDYKCDRFKKALKDWLGRHSKILIKDIFEFMGYTMTMNTNLKIAFFIYGKKNTGKTTFQTILENVIGEQNRASVSLQRMSKNEFGLDGLQFKILNMVGDMSEVKITDASNFKVLTGGDKYINAEIKGGNKYQFRNIITVWYNANGIPHLCFEDDAFYSRWILILFPNAFNLGIKGTINDFADAICEDKDEIQGIIHECIYRVRDLYKRKYFRLALIKNTKHIWKYNSDSLYAFISDYCKKDEDNFISSIEFRNKYNKFLYKRGEKYISPQVLKNELEKHNIFKSRLSTGERDYVFNGIKWKPPKGEIEKW